MMRALWPLALWMLLGSGIVLGVAASISLSSSRQDGVRLQERMEKTLEDTRGHRLASLLEEERSLLETVEERGARALWDEMARGADTALGLEAERARLLRDAAERARLLAAVRGEEIEAAFLPAESKVAASLMRDLGQDLRPLGSRGWSLLALALAVLSLVALAWHFVSLSRPLGALAQTMERLAAGGRDRATAPSAALRPLASSLNRMADTLCSSRDEFRAEVDRKTAALAQALEDQRGLNRRLSEVLEELESTQARLLRNEKLAALGTLASGVAHEFNNVLGGIRGCARELEDEVDDPELAETIQVVLRATERGRRIVDGLQSFGRGSTARPHPIDLGDAATEALRPLQEPARSRGIRFEVSAQVVPLAFADGSEIHQVIVNLLRNALDASPDGGVIRIEIAASPRSGRPRLGVIDEGPGIPPELRSRIFEPFFTTKQRQGGSGLGLAISHGIVAAAGGSLDLENPASGGAAFWIELPRAGEKRGM